MLSPFEEAAMMDKEDNEDLFHKQISVRVAVWITCSLSMLGALLIIFSYVCFKTMRSRAREILVHISVMDFLVAASNLTELLSILTDFTTVRKAQIVAHHILPL